MLPDAAHPNEPRRRPVGAIMEASLSSQASMISECPAATNALLSIVPTQPLDEHGVFSLIDGCLPPQAELSESQLAGLRADSLAFRFQRPHAAGERPWGIYWVEMASGQTPDGAIVRSPDVSEATLEIAAWWAVRSAAMAHPLLAARFADLAWEFGKLLASANENIDKPGVELARCAIDRYLDVFERRIYAHEHYGWIYLNRAIELAASLRDDGRLVRAKALAFELKRSASRPGAYLWTRFDETLWAQAKPLKLAPEDLSEAVEALEQALAWAMGANGSGTDIRHAQVAADRLTRRLRQAKRLDDAKQATRAAGRAIEAAAASIGGLAAIGHWEELIGRYREAGLIEDAARVEGLVRAEADKANAEMATMSVPVKITKEEMDAWSGQFLSGPLEEGLGKLAWDLLIREKVAVGVVKQMAREAPLWAMMGTAIKGSDGFTVSSAGSVENDLGGRAMQEAATQLSWKAPWLSYALNRTRKERGPKVDDLLAACATCGLFKTGPNSLLAQGFQAWLDEDAVKAIHVLIPQVEAALRNALSAAGGSVVEPDPLNGGFMKIGMGKILSHTAFTAEPLSDMRFHLRALFVDNRGLNLRNNIAHGLVGVDMLHMGLANWVFHSVMLVSVLRVAAKPGE